MNSPLLAVENLRVAFGPRQRARPAVADVSFTVQAGESVGLVGESGCGKSTTARALLRLLPRQGGLIRFGGRDIDALRGAALRNFRRQAQIIFQDPFGSLNPRLTIGAALSEPLRVHFGLSAAQCRPRVMDLLRAVELEPAAARRYPHEFSGGQRQRIGIARALALDPKLLVADEPVSALDVSVQAQILALLRSLSRQRHCALLLIAHDLAVVRWMCARVLVMYAGRILEAGPPAELFQHPAHPYTAALVAAVPTLAARRASAARLRLAPDRERVAETPPGCVLAGRCPRAVARCWEERPSGRELAPARWSACHFAEEMLAPR